MPRVFIAGLLLTFSLQAAELHVNDNDYLETRGFSVFLYDSTYHPVFVDQKNTAMEMILHGQRIATNGDVRLMPTPEIVLPLPGTVLWRLRRDEAREDGSRLVP